MSNGTQTYQFKPALLKSKQSYFVTNDHLELANKDGSDTCIHFKDITNLRYSDTNAREYKFRRLDITYGDGALLHISLSLPIASTARNDRNLSSFFQLIHDITRRLEHARPDLPITIGETSRINWIYFTIGALTMLGAIGILLGAYLSGVSDQKLMKSLFPVLIMAAFGAYICFMARPWVNRPAVDLNTFKRLIEKLQEG